MSEPHYSGSMNIVDASAGDITLDEAARLASRSAKTLRRAVQSGTLPRRYVIGERGPQLVFDRVDLDHWLRGRVGKSRVRRRSKRQHEEPTNQPNWPDFLATVANLQIALNENSAGILQLTIALRDQANAMIDAEKALEHLTVKLDDLEARVSNEGAETVQSRPEPGAKPNSNQWTNGAT